MASTNRSRQAAAVISALLFIICIFQGTARADNLGALVYLVFIWPIGIICVVLFIALCVITSVKIKKNTPAQGKTFPRVVIWISILIAMAFPILAVVLERSYDARSPVSAMIISILPVECAALICIALNRKLLRRAG